MSVAGLVAVAVFVRVLGAVPVALGVGAAVPEPLVERVAMLLSDAVGVLLVLPVPVELPVVVAVPVLAAVRDDVPLLVAVLLGVMLPVLVPEAVREGVGERSGM